MNPAGVPVKMTDAGIAFAAESVRDHATIDRFLALSVKGLQPMLDQKRQLFCFRLKKTDQGMVQEGISQRYTAMTLMGLHRLTQAGGTSPFHSSSIIEALFSDLEWVDNIGDLGVLLWLCGIACPERFEEIERRLDPFTALRRFQGARQGVTMELAWFLTGLSYWVQRCPEKSAQLEPVAFETYKTLLANQGERGFFGHLSTSRSLSGMVRGRIGSYADQVYPIYGMAQFSKAYGHEDAAHRSLKCAMGICEDQGPQGQWWWHYDGPNGQVADGYPVFSVHQHAMGPMTLFGLGEIINRSFDEWIYKGVRWINSNNELSYDMEDPANGVIWRCIFRSQRSIGRYLKAAMGRNSGPIQHNNPADLEILFECRPYELGWLLYAFSPLSRRPRAISAKTTRNSHPTAELTVSSK
jgi:hypothetical protein